MKKFAFIAALVIPLIVVAAFVANDKASNKGPQTTFYETPLVCNAAPEIGCGSRAKPALLALEKNPAVKEAWLNRAGTVIAIVWMNEEMSHQVAEPIFRENNIDFKMLDDAASATLAKTFRQEKHWYRGGNVDQLSREEATTIAENSVRFALDSNLISRDEAEKIKGDIEAYFKIELVKIRTNDQLTEDSENKFMLAMYEIGAKHIGKERTEKALELYQQGVAQQCKKDGACEQPGTKKSCCNK